MTFEIGDKVRLTGTAWDFVEHGPRSGEIVMVSSQGSDGSYWFDWNGEEYYIGGGWTGELVEPGNEFFEGYSHTWTGNPNTSEDLINDPSHCRQGGIAVHEVLDAYGLDRKHYLASATEYILRSGFKGSEESDLRKAVWHLNHYIEQHFGQEQG